MTFLDSLVIRSQQLETEIAKWQRVIDGAPAGHLISRKAKSGGFNYSLSSENTISPNQEHYIPKTDRKLAEQVALKEYAIKRILDARSEKYALDLYISAVKRDKKADRYLMAHPGAAELVLPQLRSKNDYIKAWTEADYRRNESFLEYLKYPTIVPNLMVRSKAEADITSRLVHYGVPFRYEEEHVINGRVVYPDFTCLNVRTLKEVYWEHQGLWDKKEYVDAQKAKENLYAEANIIPFKNLIITTETYDQPLDIFWVDNLIQFFLL